MCGIAGWIGFDSAAPEVAERVECALHHRGPDAKGIKSWKDATLIHTRLSILDLSSNGSQPMSNEDGSIWTVFNGEIYNHRQLRKELKLRGHIFKGCSDTEILPHLYEEHGVAMAAKLRGMFAIAIYDMRTGKMLLIRDRFGIKPLFYATAPGRISFASEIRALRQLPGIDQTPDRQAIYDFASLFFIPAPQTYYRGIRSLCPGELLEADTQADGVRFKVRKYYTWTVQPDEHLSLRQATDHAEALIEQAVRRQLESDVPLGTLLSGGIDSSLITWAAQNATRSLRSFNVRFSESGFDESWAAAEVARHLGSAHTTIGMDDTPGSWDQIVSILKQAGQPFADSSVFAASAVCEFMRQEITVALSGDGGDEGFGGYDTFWRIGAVAHWQSAPAPLKRVIAESVGPGLSQFGLFPSRYCRRLRELSLADDTGILQNFVSWIRPEEHARLCSGSDLLPVRRWFEPQWTYVMPKCASRLDRLSAHATEVQMRLRLPNDYLFKVDLASMRSSLEVRVPMLDEDLVELGLRLPHWLKVRRRTCKLVLRNVARRHLPHRVACKKKAGFRVPMDRWTTPQFKTNVREFLLGSNLPLQDFFRREAYEPLVLSFCSDHPHPAISRAGLYERIIMLLSLALAVKQ